MCFSSFYLRDRARSSLLIHVYLFPTCFEIHSHFRLIVLFKNSLFLCLQVPASFSLPYPFGLSGVRNTRYTLMRYIITHQTISLCAAQQKILPEAGGIDGEKRTQNPLQIKALQYHLRWWNPIKSRKTIIRQWIQLGYIRIVINLSTNKCCG